jgi:hypothetical protein
MCPVGEGDEDELKHGVHSTGVFCLEEITVIFTSG